MGCAWPLRAGWGFYTVTYGTLAAVYAAALLARSVWGPLQLIGATAGALIAFVFPALLILHAERLPQVRPALLLACGMLCPPFLHMLRRTCVLMCGLTRALFSVCAMAGSSILPCRHHAVLAGTARGHGSPHA